MGRTKVPRTSKGWPPAPIYLSGLEPPCLLGLRSIGIFRNSSSEMQLMSAPESYKAFVTFPPSWTSTKGLVG